MVRINWTHKNILYTPLITIRLNNYLLQVVLVAGDSIYYFVQRPLVEDDVLRRIDVLRQIHQSTGHADKYDGLANELDSKIGGKMASLNSSR